MHQPFPEPDPTDDGSPQDHVTRPAHWPRPYTERHHMPPLLPGVTPPRGFLPAREPEPYSPAGDPAEVCGVEAAARLDALRMRRDAGGYPDDREAHLNAHRLAFARYLVARGKLSEETE